MRNGSFRPDLYFRLNVLTLRLPGLNKRGTDILEIASVFLKEYYTRFGKKPLTLSRKAAKLFMEHYWEGNIRELRNVCESLAVLNRKGIIEAEDVAEIFDESAEQGPVIPPASHEEDLEKFELEKILKTLELCGDDKTAAAKHLQMSKTTLWRKLRKIKKMNQYIK
jgi:DNA-binding NtrC family response regulator